MAQVSGNIGTVNKSYISVVANGFLDQREIKPEILDLQNDGAWIMFNDEMGYTSWTTTNAMNYQTTYNDPLLRKFTVTNPGSASSTAFTFDISNASPYINDYIKVGDTLLFPNGDSPRVTSVTAPGSSTITVTVASANGNTVVLAAGDIVSVNGAALGEGSAATSPFRRNLSFINNYIQILDEVYTFTDVQAATPRTVMFQGSPYVVTQTAIDAYLRLQAKMAMTYWTSEINETTAVNFKDSTTAVQRTRGLDKYVEGYGIKPSVASAGTISTPDLADVCSRLTAVKAPSDYFMFGSNDVCGVMDIWTSNLNSSGATSVRINKTDSPLNFTAKALTFNGFNWKIMSQPILSNPDTFNYKGSGGTTTQKIARSMYLLPQGQAKVFGGSTTKYFGMKYAQMDTSMSGGLNTVAGNGRVYEFKDGGLYGIGTTATATGRYYTQMGVEANLPQLYGRWVVK